MSPPLSLLPLTVVPLFVQIFIAYTLGEYGGADPKRTAYISGVSLCTGPLMLYGGVLRLMGEGSIFYEALANCALILQTAFFHGYERRVLGLGTPLFILCYLFLSELFMDDGDCFRHRVATGGCAIYALQVVSAAAGGAQFVAYAEFGLMAVLGLIEILAGERLHWHVPAFLAAVPFAFPLSNIALPALDPKREGVLGFLTRGGKNVVKI